MKVVIAIHDAPAWVVSRSQAERVAAALPNDAVAAVWREDDRLSAFRDADVLFAFRISARECEAAARLRWIHSPSVGVGQLLIPEVAARDVTITNSRGVHSEAIAEHAMALALILRRGLHVAMRRQAAREWAQIDIARLAHAAASRSHLLVIGLRTIGTAVARMASGLGMTVTAVRRRLDQPVPEGVSRVFPIGRLSDALADADVVVLAAPATRDTVRLI